MSFNTTDLSPHLFWDCSIESIEPERSKKLIIHRVLDYGLLNDWRIIQAHYGVAEIGKIATTIRDLDTKSMAFISALAKIPEAQFSCYTTIQSQSIHWNF